MITKISTLIICLSFMSINMSYAMGDGQDADKSSAVVKGSPRGDDQGNDGEKPKDEDRALSAVSLDDSSPKASGEVSKDTPETKNGKKGKCTIL